MSETMASLLIKAIVEDEEFQFAIDKAVDMANSTDELPISEQIDQAITEHDTILNLIARVEVLEENHKKLDIDLTSKVLELEKAQAPEETKPVGDLKPVAHGILQVCEDKNYGMYLARQNSDWEVQHLYAVTYHLPGGSVTRYVIAESLVGAVSQGCCGLGVHDGDRAFAEKTATGIQLPLMLRGWSSHQF